MNTTKIIKLLTIITSALATLLAGLATLSVPSDQLPMPAEWRPYLVPIAFIVNAARIAFVPMLESIIKTLKEP